MYYFSKVLIMVALLCPLISCGLPSSSSTIVPMGIIDSNIYTTEIQGHFEQPHYAVFAIVNCEVHGGYTPYSQYKTDHPLEIPDTTFSGYPVYDEGTTIKVKMTAHRETALEGVWIKDVAVIRAEFVFIGFCAPGTYKLNVNGLEKAFSVGHRK